MATPKMQRGRNHLPMSKTPKHEAVHRRNERNGVTHISKGNSNHRKHPERSEQVRNLKGKMVGNTQDAEG